MQSGESDGQLFSMLYLEGSHRQYVLMGQGILVQRVALDLSNCKYEKRRTEERRHERGVKNPAQRGFLA